jgi:hypothetical protein
MINAPIRADRDRWNSLQNESKVEVMAASQTGFTPYAEVLNGRLAMIGFVWLLTLATLNSHGIFSSLVQLVSNR